MCCVHHALCLLHTPIPSAPFRPVGSLLISLGTLGVVHPRSYIAGADLQWGADAAFGLEARQDHSRQGVIYVLLSANGSRFSLSSRAYVQAAATPEGASGATPAAPRPAALSVTPDASPTQQRLEVREEPRG